MPFSVPTCPQHYMLDLLLGEDGRMPAEAGSIAGAAAQRSRASLAHAASAAAAEAAAAAAQSGDAEFPVERVWGPAYTAPAAAVSATSAALRNRPYILSVSRSSQVRPLPTPLDEAAPRMAGQPQSRHPRLPPPLPSLRRATRPAPPLSCRPSS